jgi:hypothetical protein
MPILNTTRRPRRKARSSLPLFDWARDGELLSQVAVRAVARRINVSPAVALVLAELSGLMRERH